MKTALSILLALTFARPVSAETFKAYAAAALQTPLIEMAAEYERASGQKITFVFDTAGATQQKFFADPSATFLITTDALIRDAEKSGTLKNGRTNRLADTVAGFAVPPGSAKPDISTAAKLKATLISARTIAFADPARGATVGTHFMKVIESLGIKEEVLKKATLARDGAETMQFVLQHKADLGLTQVSEIIQADRAALVGPFPKEFELTTTYTLWRPMNISSEAEGFVRLITSPEFLMKLEQFGLRAPNPQ